MNRREMLLTAGAGAAALLLPRAALRADDAKPFSLPKLPYDYDALEPIIDKQTMMTHHDKHHQAYVDNLNKAVAGKDEAKLSIEELVAKAKKLEDMKLRLPVRNNAGGHFNHTFFWTIMAPKGQGGAPEGELAKAIEAFGGLEKLKMEVLTAALGRFGSGWAWVEVADGGTLKVSSSANQDNPWMDGKKAILGIDVWEHAYYLKYQNKRADYVKAWWDVANWKQIGENFNKAKG
jgi:Fe-Mn family superoxide dismutase